MQLSRDDVLFCGPSVTHLIKLGSSYEALQILTDIQFELKSNIFFPKNDNNLKFSNNVPTNFTNECSLWSLLVYCKNNQILTKMITI